MSFVQDTIKTYTFGHEGFGGFVSILAYGLGIAGGVAYAVVKKKPMLRSAGIGALVGPAALVAIAKLGVGMSRKRPPSTITTTGISANEKAERDRMMQLVEKAKAEAVKQGLDPNMVRVSAQAVESLRTFTN